MPILQWLTREEDIKTARKTPYRLLEEVQDLGYGDKDLGNMIIQGDNLEALKALLPFYAGQVKCIYIDPPYNTGSAFEHYDDNLEHSTWLSIMYPRLELLKDFLAKDGSIYIQLDDNESDYAKVLLDEIFGRRNFINRITIDARSPSSFSTVNPGVFKASEYILWYAKDKHSFKETTIKIPRDPDYAYNKWLINPNSHYSKWEFISLREAYTKKYNETGIDTRKMNNFIVNNSDHVFRFTTISNTGAGKATLKVKEESINKPSVFFCVERDGLENQYIYNGQQISFYNKNVAVINGKLSATTFLTNVWKDIAWEGIANEGAVQFKKGKKPERLIERILTLATNEGDLVMDSFLGSGTTASVAQKMGRRYIGIEMGEHAITHCVPRLEAVIDGEESGISKAVNWEGGGGFRFFKLGNEVFNSEGHINEGINFSDLSAHIWFSETKTPFNKPNSKSTFLGFHKDVAYALLYNGILRDKRVDGGNVLTSKTLNIILEDIGQTQYEKLVIYGESSRIGTNKLKELNIEFKQTPYDVKAR